jgi:AcrR family transcriptional regulator
VSPVPDRAELRREEILAAAERTFVERGYHATGIADIATLLGLGHGTFYRYFQSKHDIARHVFDRVMLRFASIVLGEEPEAPDTLAEYRAQTDRILIRLLELGDREPHILRFFHEQAAVIDPERFARVVESYVQHTARFLDNGVAKRFLRADLDVRATAEMLMALIFEGTRRAISLPDTAARRRWADAGMALMFAGCAAPARAAHAAPVRARRPASRRR